MARVLVVDDHAENRLLLVTLLKHAGHESLEARDGYLALAQVRVARPDLVICDILMSAMDGYEFVRQLRADPEIARTEVIFYATTFMEREARNLAASCGVSQVMLKLSKPDEILRKLEQTLGSASKAELVADETQFECEHLKLQTSKLAFKVNELESTNQRLLALTDLNLQLASERDPQELLNKVCRGARDLLGARCAVLAIRDESDGGATYFSSSGLPSADADPLRDVIVDAGVLGDVLSDVGARKLASQEVAAIGVRLPAALAPPRHGLVAPIVSLHCTYGWILLIDRLGADAFSDDEMGILAVCAAQTGRIYESSSLYSRLKRTAEQLEGEAEEHTRTEKELLVVNDSLEQRVRQRTAELRDLIDGLESFHRNVSHDLRGPMGRIVGAARMAQDFVVAHESARAAHFMRIVVDQATATGQLADALLTLARTSDATVVRECFDMSELAHEAVAWLQQSAPKMGVTVAVDPLTAIRADRKLARQVLVNLIGNAMKFTAGSRRPEVRVGMTGTSEAPVFFVRDNGVGFDAGQAKSLFKPFHRLHGHRFEGSGVGLSIVRRIVDHHGGRVWAESMPGQGAAFYFSLSAA